MKQHKYDCLIHSAAVSDYQTEKVLKNKIGSDIKIWNLKLVPTPKLIDLFRKTDRKLLLVGFKFEPDSGRKALLKDAGEFIRRSEADLVVANTIRGKNSYLAYITDGSEISSGFRSKKDLSLGLVKLIEQFYG